MRLWRKKAKIVLIRLRKNDKILWKLDTDDPRVIRRFMRKAKEAVKQQILIVPYDVDFEIKEMKGGKNG